MVSNNIFGILGTFRILTKSGPWTPYLLQKYFLGIQENIPHNSKHIKLNKPSISNLEHLGERAYIVSSRNLNLEFQNFENLKLRDSKCLKHLNFGVNSVDIWEKMGPNKDPSNLFLEILIMGSISYREQEMFFGNIGYP